MGGDISSLGTRFIRRWALERDLGFETAHTWTLFYCRCMCFYLVHSHKIEGNIMVPWMQLLPARLPFFLLNLLLLLSMSQNELLYSHAFHSYIK